jgi:hypothetical protein
MTVSSRYPPFHIMQLPTETLDQIASYLDLHSDLMALALASHACSRLVIPRQTQYRVLHVRHATPLLWAHLARRADLARNVREIHISEQTKPADTDRYPTTLIDRKIDAAPANNTRGMAVENMCRALGHMSQLHTFTWSNTDGRNTLIPALVPECEAKVALALSQCPALIHLGLSGPFASSARADFPVSSFIRCSSYIHI